MKCEAFIYVHSTILSGLTKSTSPYGMVSTRSLLRVSARSGRRTYQIFDIPRYLIAYTGSMLVVIYRRCFSHCLLRSADALLFIEAASVAC